MSSDPHEVGRLVTRIQEAFMETPRLALTLSDAQRRFALDRTTCMTILHALVAADVLMHTDEGEYTRFFPLLGHGRRFAVRGPNGRRRQMPLAG